MPKKRRDLSRPNASELQLYNAAEQGDGAAVARLLAAGPDANASVPGKNASGMVVQNTALLASAANGHLEVVRLLLQGGADPSLAGSGCTPLMTAAGNGRPEVLRLLLARGAAVDAVHPDSNATAFHYACDRNQPECAEALARAGCDVGIKSKGGSTGGQLAGRKGHAAVVERLRALAGAAGSELVEALEPQVRNLFLFSKGSSVPTGMHGPTCIFWANITPSSLQLWDAAKGGDLAAVLRLLAAGADPNASVAVGTGPGSRVIQATALVVAAVAGRLEAARLLLEGGADPSLADGDGGTPLIAAADEGHLEVLRLLLARGAAVDALHPDTSATAFHHACETNHPECAEALARAGCDVGIKAKCGRTGREMAGAQGHWAVVERLQALEAERPRAAQAAAGSEREAAPSGEARVISDCHPSAGVS
jgi:ankyrin repeat protein